MAINRKPTPRHGMPFHGEQSTYNHTAFEHVFIKTRDFDRAMRAAMTAGNPTANPIAGTLADLQRRTQRARRVAAACHFTGVQVIALVALWSIMLQESAPIPQHILLLLALGIAAVEYGYNLWSEW